VSNFISHIFTFLLTLSSILSGIFSHTINYNSVSSPSRISNYGTQTYSASYCYDSADRMTSVTGDANMSATGSTTVASVPTYDTHGNLTKLGNQSFKYDVSDRYRESSQAGVGYTYWVRDVEDRITLRSFNDTSYEYYNHSPSGVTVVRDGGWNITEKRISLPGLQLTLKVQGASNSGVYAAEYTVSSSLGHTLVTLASNGNLAGSNINLHRFGPFGEVINQDPNSKYEYAGSAQRRTEAEYALKFVTMGARLYLPTLGRFLSVDPVKGGTQNDYVYVVDPIGSSDFSGEWGLSDAWNSATSAVSTAAKWVNDNKESIIVGIVVFAAVAAICTTGIGCVMLAGAASGFASYATTQIKNKEAITVEGSLGSAAVGAIGGPIAKAVGGAIGKAVSPVLQKMGNIIGNSVRTSVASQPISLYIGKNSVGEVMYVGITNNPIVRWAQHRAAGGAKGRLDFETINTFANRLEARIGEQMKINEYGLGNLYNKINSINPAKWSGLGIFN
jgi:RHS repeat-associated protein